MHLSRRRLAALTAVAACGLGASSAAAAKPVKPPPTTTTKDPVVLVHGWNSSASTWNTFVSRLQGAGYTSSQILAFSYNTSQSNATTAQEVARRVDAALANNPGATKVDLVSHSMGGLSTRYYTKNLGGDAKVDQFVSLGGPNHGTDFANLCWDVSCGEMRIGSSFLTALNSGDETPGTSSYATWWSPCDDIINPDSSVALSGAQNTRTACISHGALTTDATVFGQVRDFIAP